MRGDSPTPPCTRCSGKRRSYQSTEVHAFRGEADLAFEWLERAYDQRDGGVADIKGDRLMRGLVSAIRATKRPSCRTSGSAFSLWWAGSTRF
jgi:hypothetical protein